MMVNRLWHNRHPILSSKQLQNNLIFTLHKPIALDIETFLYF